MIVSVTVVTLGIIMYACCSPMLMMTLHMYFVLYGAWIPFIATQCTGIINSIRTQSPLKGPRVFEGNAGVITTNIYMDTGGNHHGHE